MRRSALAALAVLAAGCGTRGGRPTPAPTRTTVGAAPTRPDPRPAIRPGRPQPGPEPGPNPTRDQAFAGAWAAALAMGERMDREEPAHTRRALALLAADERAVAEDLLRLPIDRPGHLPALMRSGLDHFVARESRREATRDPDARPTASALWDGSGPRHVLGFLNVWGTLRADVRGDVARACREGWRANDMTPAVRDAVVAVGGAWWLARD